ncbi:N-formylglutamate deformylase [Pseudoxanthomonas sp. SGNA-20]|uniref:N-formylglutamate deformylase n=1 Tax=Pseudoxanthomonas taiwanensis J19 TaxID=935569 RepID=A0A562D6Y3_9GAMM|nr:MULTISPECIES: N-formylglutamate deformylase [Pseudoxanthomonas]RRN56593.1 N-formylglutamate deformylase [Pseudoxanthomonas sp. SGNA-20]TWH05525.1 N-formylglutamate deformylase [Pseudoxanthomonas taiwanensis J19]
MDDIFHLHQGDAPLLISLPHDGSELPADIAARLTDSARRVPDTDWHVSRLYAFARELGASIIRPRYSRYVIDLNRPPDDASLYPGQNTTGLCPTVQFSGEPVYQPGAEPDQAEIARRLEAYWRPYHDNLDAELQRIRGQHGRVVLWEGHSIRGRLPYLFEGALPDLNLGTAGGHSCSPALRQRLEEVLAAHPQYSHVVDGRFKGGYITRHYAAPETGVQAVQLELAQRTYMDEDSFAYDPVRAEALQQVLRALLQAVLA